MDKKIIIVLIIIVVAAAVAFLYGFPDKEETASPVNNFDECLKAGYSLMESYPRQCRTPDGQTFVEDIGNELEKSDLIKVSSPRPNEIVQSPLFIEGEARGFWFFEASFPVKLFDQEGVLIASGIAQAQSDWMTENFVPFAVVLNFETLSTSAGQGLLVLEKDNPSDLPENADELRIPVLFSSQATDTKTIKLYYYNPELDRDETGNTLCSREGLVSVERQIPITPAPIQDAVKILLLGELTNEEKAQGVSTEYPLEGFSLKGALLKDGILTLEFNDSNNKTVGGSCRVGILWFQIEATAKQFPEVEQVRFLPEDIFQP